MASNQDTDQIIMVDRQPVVGLGSFHKTLPHNCFGEVLPEAFSALVEATRGSGGNFSHLPISPSPRKEFLGKFAPFVNPRAGLAVDRLTPPPTHYEMPPAPRFRSQTTAAEMTELYWMALLRDVPFNDFPKHEGVGAAAKELSGCFTDAMADATDPGRLRAGVDLPEASGKGDLITPRNVFRLGLPSEDQGPLLSQFFMRSASFGTQTIDMKQWPYATGVDYLTSFESWLHAQNTGLGDDGEPYPQANEKKANYFDKHPRYISTMRDLARFVHKDALHQAYFNAALLLLSGGAKWTAGNPYRPTDPANGLREAGFGVLGGPHILALVSEVATRALKLVWRQKWQVNLRLRPEAYGGLVHVQEVGVDGTRRVYGLPSWVASTVAAKGVKECTGTYLLPMAFTSGSPVHPAYGAGHATVAGACVTVLKAFFETEVDIETLKERETPWAKPEEWKAYVTGKDKKDPSGWGRLLWPTSGKRSGMTIEGELNKLAANVALGRSMGGVHWRTDNSRSLVLGEAMAVHVLAEITTDVVESPRFAFNTFSRRADGKPRRVEIAAGKVWVDGVEADPQASAY